MYSWPANHTRNEPSTLHRKRNAKRKEKAPNYPVLDHGTVAAATLLEDNGRFEWTTIAGAEPALLKTGNPVTVFPATRPSPLKTSRMTILHRAEQGANFMRTYFPDIDVAAELLREELTEDAKILREFENFDPYVGNQLETIICSDSSSKQSAFIAFPMGELSRDLNISPFIFSTDGRASLKPSAQPVYTFDTPIQQITVSKLKGANRKQASYLSVRTFGATSILEVKSPGSASKPDVRIKELGSVVSLDTGGKQVVDVKIASSPLDVTLVNIEGAVYKCDMGAGSKAMRLARQAVPTAGSSLSDLFWRLELTERNDDCLLLSKVDLKKLDFRTADSSLDLYTAVSNEVLTSVEDYQADGMIRLSTTNQVVWLDRRNTAKPLLAFRHNRAFDQSLEVKTIAMGNGHLTTLSSRKTGLLTIYDILRSQGSMAYVQTPPYCLTAGNGPVQKGHTFFRHPSAQPDSPATLFRLSEVGSIRAFQLSTTDVGEPLFSWSEDLQRLNAESEHLREDVSSQEPTTTDMSPAYNHIFRAHRKKSEVDAEETAESLYDLVEKAPLYWQDLNDPVEYMLTTYDVLFRSGDEPGHSTRADFLAESVVNSTRGYRAVLQRRVSADSLKKDALWDHDITGTLSKFDPDMLPDIRTIAERLRRFDLRPGLDRSAQSLRRESEAREQLALDLTLSGHVYSPHPFSKEVDPNLELETMAKTLSLDGEPPPVAFGYLRPVAKSDDEEKEMPMGVRLLLKDWDVGTDPRDFVYRDPYDNAPHEPAPVRERRPSPPKERPDLQQPPPIIASTSTNHFDASRRFMSQDMNFQHRPAPMLGSQPATTSEGLAGVSQDFMASTQILPGAYGGRPVIKKKVVKKRLGGF
ncbi:RNA polymerase I-specific transcription-initiation factor-domain-containing protein [Mycena maculata]|uniref:RNA polymerase I-specific transcription-initiation factor-domain-containing protein n=1 Tax=Mycena maculata TaxID=230809 RepID=A0AAD7K098_9AGAR|nr:RNA polymerase I-specific transcription-initiation factor-domain-containing protein [Mycena maculata]